MSTEDPKPPTSTVMPGRVGDAQPKGRRPYRAPTLRRLGSVREVTWGTGSQFEGAAVGMGNMKGPM